MRLGEIKQKIDRVIAENKNIQLKSEPLYGGQAQKVENYSEVIEVIEYISKLEWSDVKNLEVVEGLLSQYPKGNFTEVLPQDEFNKLNSYVSRINSKLPIYYSILETMVKKQDEQIINIKLPPKINTLSDLDKFNKDLEFLFKKFNLSGEFQFKGFDRGTSWYEILITGTALYKYFIACLGVACGIVHLKKTYYESEQAKLNYLTSIQDGGKANDADQKLYSDKYIDVSLEAKIKEVVSEVKDRHGKEEAELINNLVMATKDLVKELGEGVEFHLSLNPPEYANEKSGRLNIDYSKMPKIESNEVKETKQVEAPKIAPAENKK